jgi:hypothetical protein
VLTRQPTGAVYILAMRWISMASAAGVGGGSDAGIRGTAKDRYVYDAIHSRHVGGFIDVLIRALFVSLPTTLLYAWYLFAKHAASVPVISSTVLIRRTFAPTVPPPSR